ncbi:MAG: SDR family oxidoreductase [Tannerella sp.]|jgi:NAD(P)H dehydrogenase (quinone)|nr:SDR family oxidoreductase [Tannerella sp.]
MNKILITGATGNFGSLTVNALLQKGVSADRISALVRDENKASDLKNKGVAIVKGNYDDYASLTAGFQGVETLLFVSGSDVTARLPQHENVVKAAKEAGVKHVVYTSFERKNETETSPIWAVAEAHLKTEQWLKESGLAYTILRNNLYMDMIPFFIGEKALETGVIYLPAGTGKASVALRSEMAEAAAAVLTSTGHENRTYNISNVEAYSYDDVAKYITEVTGKEIAYVSPTVEEYVQTLTGAGVPAEFIGIFAGFAAAQAQGELAAVSNDLQTLLGRQPTSLKAFLGSVYA